MIEFKEMSKAFGEATILKKINLSIEQGEFVILLGPSGCGKTTLLNIIGLMDTITDGSYLLNDVDTSTYSVKDKAIIRNQQIGFVFQAYHLIKHLKVVDNVALPLGYAGVSTAVRRQKAQEVLQIVGLSDKVNELPSALSGGQKQRVAIARAIISQPQLIIADEPTGNLDSETSKVIMDYFKKLHQAGHTIIMSTHNKELVNYATRVINLFDGVIQDE